MLDTFHYLYSSTFIPLSSGHGGNRRTAQIHELLQQINAILSPLADHLYFKRAPFKVLDYMIALPASARAVGLPSKTSCFDWSYIQATESALKMLFDNSVEVKGLLWENTKDYRIPYAVAGKLPLIALPHNIESLVSYFPEANLINYAPVSSVLGSELRQLAKADLVISISEYDSWLLSSFGIKSLYLPYWPCIDVETSCLQIRDARSLASTHSEFILVIGSAVNPPTVHGILKFLEAFPKYQQLLDLEILLVGYSTEIITDLTTLPPNVRVLGSVDSISMNQLLITCKCVLIHQEYGTGSLTKIPELLLSGVPIVASRIASRNFSEHDDILIYDEIGEIYDILKSNLNQPRRPLRNRQEEVRVLDKLINL